MFRAAKPKPLQEGTVKIGLQEVSHTHLTHVGPRSIHGSVTLQFDGNKPYSFTSHARWPHGENYEDAIRLAVETVLRAKLGSLDRVAVVLKSIDVDPFSSCQAGFERAARAAALSLFQD
jgi:hypothetical protein